MGDAEEVLLEQIADQQQTDVVTDAVDDAVDEIKEEVQEATDAAKEAAEAADAAAALASAAVVTESTISDADVERIAAKVNETAPLPEPIIEDIDPATVVDDEPETIVDDEEPDSKSWLHSKIF